MLAISIALCLLAALGVMAMGVKYIRATPLIDYYAEITREEEVGEETRLICGALYKVMGGVFLSLGAILAVVAVFGMGADLLQARVAILLGAWIVGGVSALVPRGVEKATGVRTPWRIAAALTPSQLRA